MYFKCHENLSLKKNKTKHVRPKITLKKNVCHEYLNIKVFLKR